MKYALCVGINEYAGLPDARLNGCVADAQDWSSMLFGHGFAITMLTDADATRDAILTALRTMISSARRGDTVVFTNSTHGSWTPDLSGDEPDHRDELICAHDVASGGQITDDELHAAFQQRAWGVKAVLISDSCHSGTLARFANLGPPNAVAAGSAARSAPDGARLAVASPKQPRFLPPDVFLRGESGARALVAEQMAVPVAKPRPQALLMAGCRDDQFSYDAFIGGRARGAFSAYALGALASMSPSASYQAWHRAIRDMLPNDRYDQEPQINGSWYAKRGRALG